MTNESVSHLIDDVIEEICPDETVKKIIYDICDVEKAYWDRKRDNADKLKKYDQIFSSITNSKGGKHL